MTEEKYSILKGGLKSGTRILKNKLKGIDDKVPEQVKANRLAICNACPHLNKFLKQCNICKCFINYKTGLKEEFCPDKRWEAHQDE